MRLILLAATAAAVLLAGCGRDVPRGRVHGKVTLNGKPLTGATVVFVAHDGKTHVLNLGPDGSYAVEGVALGPVKVAVQADAPKVASKGEFDVPSSAAKGVTDEKAGKAAAPPPEPKAAPPRVSPQYANAEKSGLTFELKGADQEWSVDLK